MFRTIRESVDPFYTMDNNPEGARDMEWREIESLKTSRNESAINFLLGDNPLISFTWYKNRRSDRTPDHTIWVPDRGKVNWFLPVCLFILRRQQRNTNREGLRRTSSFGIWTKCGYYARHVWYFRTCYEHEKIFGERHISKGKRSLEYNLYQIQMGGYLHDILLTVFPI